MKFFKAIIVLFIAFNFSCKTETKETPKPIEKEQSILEKIADAHGFENWKDVNKIQFTFNVDRDSTHFERSWIWQPKSNDVTRISGVDTLNYNRKNMDSIAIKTNGGFINDRFWLLAPFNLVWDSNNFEYQQVENDTAPISKKSLQKLTIVYGKQGGYTPGDAYDFYFDNDYRIQEWVFRKSNQPEASMTTTWENYKDYNGIIIASDHKKEKEVFNLFFDDIIIQLDQ